MKLINLTDEVAEKVVSSRRYNYEKSNNEETLKKKSKSSQIFSNEQLEMLKCKNK